MVGNLKYLEGGYIVVYVINKVIYSILVCVETYIA